METWSVPTVVLGGIVAQIPAPLGIGKVVVEEGAWTCRFICKACGVEGAEEITVLGSWHPWITGNARRRCLKQSL